MAKDLAQHASQPTDGVGCRKILGHVICESMGNPEQIGNKHYLKVTEDHFRKALGQPTMLHEVLHSDVISGPQESSAACGEQAQTTKKRPRRES